MHGAYMQNADIKKPPPEGGPVGVVRTGIVLGDDECMFAFYREEINRSLNVL